MRLFPHQLDAIDKISSAYLNDNIKGFSLNDDMGLGKTITSIGILANMYNANKVKTVLVIAPTAVIKHWSLEIPKIFTDGNARVFMYHGNDKRSFKFEDLDLSGDYINIVITTPATLIADVDADIHRVSCNYVWDFLILDESHTYRNPATVSFQAISLLRRSYTLLLTGTPFNNTSMDLATQFYLMCYPVPSVDSTKNYVYSSRKAKEITYLSDKTINPYDKNPVRARPTDNMHSLLYLNPKLKSSYNIFLTLNGKLATARTVSELYDNRVELLNLVCTQLTEGLTYRERTKIEEKIAKMKTEPATPSEFLKILFRLDKEDTLYELQRPDLSLIEQIEHILYRKLAIMQWRFILDSDPAFLAPLFKMLTLRRTKDIITVENKIPPMHITLVDIEADEITTINHAIYAKKFAKAWSQFNEAKFIAGNRQSPSKLGTIMGIVTKLRQSTLSSRLVHAKEAVLYTTINSELFTLRDFMEQRYKNGNTGKDITKTFADYGIKIQLPSAVPDASAATAAGGAGRSNTYDGVGTDEDDSDSDESQLARLYNENTPVFALDGKIPTILSELEKIPADAQVVIFSNWVTYLMLLREHMTATGVKCQIISGTQTLAARNGIIEGFGRKDFRVLLASIKACGVGINLTCATHVIFCEPSWNPFGEELQALQRIHRIGQTKDTYASYIMTKIGDKYSIDHYVQRLQDNKIISAGSLLGDLYLTTYQKDRTTKSDGSKLQLLAKMI